MHRKDSSTNLTKGLGAKTRASLSKVCRFAEKYLSSLSRRSGETYADHGLEVASVLRDITDDPILLHAAVLHDLPLHPDHRELLALSPLNAEEKDLIHSMHNLRRLHIDANVEDLDTVIELFGSDARLLPLRMAHRLNDVRHLNRFSKTLQKEIAKETLHMYSAIAGRLGMHAWRIEMEDSCFPTVQPRMASSLRMQFDKAKQLDTACLRHTKTYLQRAFVKEKISCDIEGRIKGLYSTYRKMVLKKRRFKELTDRLALRIVVNRQEDCYRALGIVHAKMHPIPGKLKDYIGAPKENGYRSIHTVVYPLPGVTEQPIEIQIRSKTMHRECEYGTADHSEYKHALYALKTNTARVNLFRNLEHLRDAARSPKQFEQALRTYFREDQIAIFDHQNNLYHLSTPATALDFVFSAFPRRTPLLKSVKINGRAQPIDTPLRDGDTVEPKFSQKRLIKKEWLHACRQSKTKKGVRTMML